MRRQITHLQDLGQRPGTAREFPHQVFFHRASRSACFLLSSRRECKAERIPPMHPALAGFRKTGSGDTSARKPDQHRFSSIALGSLRECQAILDFVPKAPMAVVKLADNLGAHLDRLIHSQRAYAPLIRATGSQQKA